MSDSDSSRLWLFLCVVLWVLHALATASSVAVQNVSENKLRKLAEGGNARARALLKTLKDPAPIADVLQASGALCALSASALTTLWGVRQMLPWLYTVYPFMDTHREWGALVCALVVLIPVTALLVAVSGRMPARVGAHLPESTLLSLSPIWRCMVILGKPIAVVLITVGRGLAQLFRVDPAAEEEVTEEDILELMDAGEETGAIEGMQKDMIENIFAFDDITAEEVMTPRSDVTALDIDSTPDEALAACIQDGFSRIPLYEQDMDHIVGILYVKDLLPFVGKPISADVTLRSLAHDTVFVPASKRCGTLFGEMTEAHIQMCVVVDEYGGVAGIVTMEDLLESIVGNIQDEYDHEEEELRRTGDDSFEVDGTMAMEELCELWELPLPDGEFDTVAGFILHELGRIPAPDEHVQVTYARLTLTVLKMDDLRIDKVHIKVNPVAEESAE